MLTLLLACVADGPPTPVAVAGDLAPDFTLLSNSGADVTLSTYADRVVLLDFSEFW